MRTRRSERWLWFPLLLSACSKGDDDSTGNGLDDTGSPSGATHVTADTTGSMDGGDVDAIEMIHIVGGAFAELTNVPEFNFIVEGTLSKLAPPPPIGSLSCIEKTVASGTEVTISFDKCEDDRSGSVHLEGVNPTSAGFRALSLYGYTIDGNVTFSVGKPVGYDFETTGKMLTVTGNGRTAEITAEGNVVSEFMKDDGLMSLNAEMTVTEDGTSRPFLVGTGIPTFGAMPPYPLTWSLVASTPRRPIEGTISFTATSGTYLAHITAETLQSEIGIPKESVPLAGIQDVEITLAAPPVIQINYGKTSAIGINVDHQAYDGTIQTADLVALAQDCVLSQADCEVLATGIDDALADEVTVLVDASVVTSAFGVAYSQNFDDTLTPLK
jgi:hypothetical protein